MTNVCMIVRDRPRLTEQTLRTLYEETPRDQFTLTVCDDGSWPETAQILARYSRRDNCEVVTFLRSVGIVGFLRNVGVWTSERYFGRGDYLCLIDNDIAFLNKWLKRMVAAYTVQVGVLGGYQHPFHGPRIEQPSITTPSVIYTDAVAGYMHFMNWRTWDEFGPYDQHAKGVCQSEDFAFCQKILKEHSTVAYIHPPVIANCGVTNSEGKPAVGSESFIRYPGLIYS